MEHDEQVKALVDQVWKVLNTRPGDYVAFAEELRVLRCKVVPLTPEPYNGNPPDEE